MDFDYLFRIFDFTPQQQSDIQSAVEAGIISFDEEWPAFTKAAILDRLKTK